MKGVTKWKRTFVNSIPVDSLEKGVTLDGDSIAPIFPITDELLKEIPGIVGDGHILGDFKVFLKVALEDIVSVSGFRER